MCVCLSVSAWYREETDQIKYSRKQAKRNIQNRIYVIISLVLSLSSFWLRACAGKCQKY